MSFAAAIACVVILAFLAGALGFYLTRKPN